MVTFSRIKPYSTNQRTWSDILRKNFRIPMNQREYSWENEQISRFLDDIFKIFEENKYQYKMGSIINLNYNGANDIYDGQQRILTIILILNVIGCLSIKLKNKINELLTIDTELDTLTQEQEEIKVKCNVNILPKIYCINPYDMKGLVNIFNNNITSWVAHLYNPDKHESFSERGEYICKHCNQTIGRKADFIRHITKKHNFISQDSSTKLHGAFIEIYNWFKLKKYNEKQLIDLYKFMLNDIDIQYYDCTDPEYVSRIFDWENNRGKTVETLDIIKNPVLVQIPDDKKVEVYEKWEKLKHTSNKVYKKDFGQKIFNIAIQLYNNKIKRKINLEELFKPIIENENTYQEINKFFAIVEKLIEIMGEINNDTFGRLITNTNRICICWEGYMYLLLPIFYHTGINSELIKLLTTWYFRNLQFKTRSFNNLCYSNTFIEITNTFLDDRNFNYFQQIKDCLQKNKDDCINSENYLRSLQTRNFKSTNATYILMFLETVASTDLYEVPFGYTLEHIYCQKNKGNLSNQSLMDNIGNLTLIEGKNSSNGHKGNSSLGSKDYSKKRKSYEGSSSVITRNVAKNYETFVEETIIERNKDIIELLNKHTNY